MESGLVTVIASIDLGTLLDQESGDFRLIEANGEVQRPVVIVSLDVDGGSQPEELRDVLPLATLYRHGHFIGLELARMPTPPGPCPEVRDDLGVLVQPVAQDQDKQNEEDCVEH